MTTPSADVANTPAPAKPAPLWEDFIDIFHSPSTVYARRENSNPWPMILILTAIFALVMYFTFSTVEPAIEAELRADAAKAMAKNPQMTQDMADQGTRIQLVTRRWGGVFMPIGILVSALFVWILAKLIGAKAQTYTKAMVVVTWATIIAIVQQLLIALQGLVMDVSSMTTPDKLGFSAARFVDKAATSPILYAVLKSLDVFGIWVLVVMSIGVMVTGKATKNQAITFAVIWFTVSLAIAAAMGARAAAGG